MILKRNQDEIKMACDRNEISMTSKCNRIEIKMKFKRRHDVNTKRTCHPQISDDLSCINLRDRATIHWRTILIHELVQVRPNMQIEFFTKLMNDCFDDTLGDLADGLWLNPFMSWSRELSGGSFDFELISFWTEETKYLMAVIR